MEYISKWRVIADVDHDLLKFEPVRFAFLICTAESCLVSGCAKERSLQPLPAKYNLYVAAAAAGAYDDYVLTIDCESDSIVDRLSVPFRSMNLGSHIFASPQPGFLLIPLDGGHKVVDMTSHQTTASLPGTFNSVAFFPECGRLVGARSDSTFILEDTTYAIRRALDIGFMDCHRIGTTTRLIGATDQFSPKWPLLIIDVLTGAIVDSLQIDPTREGVRFSHSGFDISGDGSKIYGSYDAIRWPLIGIDISHKSVLFEYSVDAVECDGSACYVSPDDREVWYEWDVSPWCGGANSVGILDAYSGASDGSIRFGDFASGWLQIWQVRFVPDTPKGYVSCTALSKDTSAVFVLDSKTREVLKTVFIPDGRYPIDIAIGPAP